MSVFRIFILLLRMKSNRFLVLMEKDRTLEIIRYPMKPKEMYCEYVLKEALMFSA